MQGIDRRFVGVQCLPRTCCIIITKVCCSFVALGMMNIPEGSQRAFIHTGDDDNSTSLIPRGSSTHGVHQKGVKLVPLQTVPEVRLVENVKWFRMTPGKVNVDQHCRVNLCRRGSAGRVSFSISQVLGSSRRSTWKVAVTILHLDDVRLDRESGANALDQCDRMILRHDPERFPSMHVRTHQLTGNVGYSFPSVSLRAHQPSLEERLARPFLGRASWAPRLIEGFSTTDTRIKHLGDGIRRGPQRTVNTGALEDLARLTSRPEAVALNLSKDRCQMKL